MILNPDEIIQDLRRSFIIRNSSSVDVISTQKVLYGVPIYVIGEGLRGQYLNHYYVEREERYWIITYGWTTLYGVTDENVIIPLLVLGFPTIYIDLIREGRIRLTSTFVIERELGTIECKEKNIVNLSRVMQQKEAILVLDPHNLLPAPPERYDEIIELQDQIRKLEEALFNYERKLRDYQTQVNILQHRNQQLLLLTTEYRDRITKLATEITSLQHEIQRLRSELSVRVEEVETSEEVRRRLTAIIDTLTETITKFSETVNTIISSLEALPKPPKPEASVERRGRRK